MLEIDGSHGEGGGQILRTALSLSSLSGTPFRIVNIRRGRRKPGLMPQHMAAVRAAQAISAATVEGAEHGSTVLAFTPHALSGGSFAFDIGTAGAVTLVLQTLIPPLLRADRPSRVLLSGGTHVPFSPSVNYLAEVFAPMLKRLGGELRLSIEAYGFYPRGGGRIRAEIIPARELRPLSFSAPDEPRRATVTGCSGVCRLPLSIAERQRTASLAALGAMPADSFPPPQIELLEAPGPGQGTFLFLRAETGNGLAGSTALGARGKRAETVGSEAADELCRHLATGAALDPHLADQLVPFLALSRGESDFTTSRITPHLLTNLWVAGLFLPLRVRVAGEEGGAGRVTITPC
ncbi:MAG: RNA 3'-phosphate cyclase [Deltaproteobacteria bacterium]|nr:RNA 3'-phosphate cyclase [Deltaproteobacteria bacterium]